MKNILIAFAVFLSLCFIVPVSAKATTFDIVVPLDVVVPIRGAQCALTFNPAVCQCLGIAEGNFLNDWAVANHDVTIEYPQPVIDNANGIVSDIGIAIMGTNKGGVVGSGIFCIYHMVGEPQYSVVDVVVADQYGNVIK